MAEPIAEISEVSIFSKIFTSQNILIFVVIAVLFLLVNSMFFRTKAKEPEPEPKTEEQLLEQLKPAPEVLSDDILSSLQYKLITDSKKVYLVMDNSKTEISTEEIAKHLLNVLFPVTGQKEIETLPETTVDMIPTTQTKIDDYNVFKIQAEIIHRQTLPKN